ncbi:hypothetical protein CALCODRAFT_503331 [Calocera cornea HHB12733]|uniref:Uncharacterized protein n=1 Tax=Calocera cornea HHB12733 TaxID=1353952 RepID=A0A165CWV0_9BASI|nr:hypothetical protein CALCODRAFT_503331 [Calocera cornea HHB12733]
MDRRDNCRRCTRPCEKPSCLAFPLPTFPNLCNTCYLCPLTAAATPASGLMRASLFWN